MKQGDQFCNVETGRLNDEARGISRRDALKGGVAIGVGAAIGAPALTRAQDEVELSIWSYLAPDDASVKAYIETFQEQNPNIKIKYTAYPEDDYQDKVRTALSAGGPPDIAIIEDRRWMKAGFVVELTDHYAAWGVDPNDFNSGGMARTAPEGDISAGIYAVGDFLGGNVIFYNKGLFDEAGIAHPSETESMQWPQFDEIARQLGKPDRNPANAVYGCTVTHWYFGIWAKWIWGEDGHEIVGNLNSEPVVDAWNRGTALVRDGIAPGASLIETLPAGESDLFAQGKIAMTWSDFTEASKYTANDIDFGLAPFVVIEGSESFVDTWTAPWGTFTESKHPEEALAFLKFIATDAQRIRAETSSDPPLSTKVAEELEWGKDDPIKQQYLTVLQQAKPQVFVPGSFLPEGTYDSEEVFRKMTVERQEDAKPLLDEAAEKTQPELDKAWEEWEKLSPETAG
jgi:multiple sugar transport system substrate-binding protein